MAAFTTNVEYGVWADSGKVVFGAPPKADKNSYLKHYAEQYRIPVSETLADTLDDAMAMLEDGAERSGGERYVPLFIWRTDSFQSWYKAQTGAGNRLEEAKLLFNYRPGYKKFVFLWVLKVGVYIESEDRHKTNEFVLARTDTATVLLYHKPNDSGGSVKEHEVVLIKEFRSPASTPDGFIRELPGGSSLNREEDTADIAASEVHEETGFYLDPSRLVAHGARQLSGTFASHKSHLYSAHLSAEEIEWFKSQDGIVHGKEEDTERTFIEVKTIYELINKKEVDWSTLGMILSVIVPSSG